MEVSVINDPRRWGQPPHGPYSFPPQYPYRPQASDWALSTPNQFMPYGPAWTTSPSVPLTRRPRRAAVIMGGIALLALFAATVGAVVALTSGSSDPQKPTPIPGKSSTTAPIPTVDAPRLLPAAELGCALQTYGARSPERAEPAYSDSYYC